MIIFELAYSDSGHHFKHIVITVLTLGNMRTLIVKFKKYGTKTNRNVWFKGRY